MKTLGGRYRLEHPIGSGGMAPVWRAHDDVLDRPVAVKLLTADDTADPAAFDRARNEARCAARLAHPNVGAVYDFGTSRRAGRGTAFLVMELVEGPLLSEYLRGGPLHWAFAVRVGAEVSAGLAEAHSRGIVHRDVKPANVVLTQAGAKILDFGVAARTGQPDRQRDGIIEGTPGYMAPERFTGAPVAPALDMFGVGVLLHRCLTGQLPWAAEDPSAGPVALPPIDGLDPEAARICVDCLDLAPDRRPTAVAAALILAASVDAQVYLPSMPRPTRPADGFTPTDRDLHAATAAHQPPPTAG